MLRIELKQVGRIFHWRWAVHQVTDCWTDAEIVCVLGPNGSGKSTLLKLVGGVIRPTEGQVDWDGSRVRAGALGQKRQMMLLAPDQRLVGPDVISHLSTLLAVYEHQDAGVWTVAKGWLDKFQLSLRLSQNELSRGQRMKIWLTALLTIRPMLWLLDEPHQSGLDARGMELLEQEIAEHRAAGGTVVFTSQCPAHATQLANRVLLLDQGALMFAGCPRQLASRQLVDGDQPLDGASDNLGAVVRGL